MFVTRLENGRPFGSGYYPFTEFEPARSLILRDEPFPVFSCWNAMAAFDARPFREHAIRFRALLPERRVLSMQALGSGECHMDSPDRESALPLNVEASECCLVHADLRRLGHGRIFVNPTVRLAYSTAYYNVHNYVVPWFYWAFWIFNRPDATEYEHQLHRVVPVEERFPMAFDAFDETCLW